MYMYAEWSKRPIYMYAEVSKETYVCMCIHEWHTYIMRVYDLVRNTPRHAVPGAGFAGFRLGVWAQGLGGR